MKSFDAFNGDADGLCALVQLRLADPRPSTIVTGVKRDIQLLDRVLVNGGDHVTVMDVSLDSNRSHLERILKDGASVDYFDHHFAGEIPADKALNAIIDPSAEICTSLLVDRRLGGTHSLWAIAGAFGDNLSKVATSLAKQRGLTTTATEQLRELGEALNYNAYGESVEDLRYSPADLFGLLLEARDPFAFIAAGPHFATLKEGLAQDVALARAVRPLAEYASAVACLLPDAAWARRVSGMFANELAFSHPLRAHAILTRHSSGGYTVSVRAPSSRPAGADTLCRRFPTGGGRTGAAGINRLPEDQLAPFLDALRQQYSEEPGTC
jgi:hypothetical protein